MKDDDDEDQADGSLHQVKHNPALLHEQHIADEDADAGRAELRQHGHGERGAFAADMQTRLDPFLINVDVFLELARQELAHLGMQAVHIGDEGEQPHQHQQQDG